MKPDDIVFRLRQACTGGAKCECSYRVAADEIVRLQEENAALRAALQPYLADFDDTVIDSGNK